MVNPDQWVSCPVSSESRPNCGSYLARSMGLPPSDPPSPTIRISVTRGTESGSSAPAVVSEEMEEGFLATGVVPSVRTSAAAKVDMISTAFYQNIRHDEY